ncbi:zinc finger protein 91-like [Palaemon carinicauda]|uniref:zinc finger protein 91-like n=1 Tax=Palaemon carinicauda TaxID=392227 RepID=UPI0035B5DFAA
MKPEEGYSCEICKKSFSRKSKLSSHLRCHIEPIKEELDEYLKVEDYSDQEVLENSTDFQVFPKTELEGEKSCSHCQKTFGRNDLLCHHIVLCHPDEALKCKVCSKVFLTRAKYHTHYSEHLLGVSDEKPIQLPYNVSESTDNEGKVGSYKCQICKKAFTCYTNLWSHAWVHTDEKPYVCNVCGRGFGRLYRLRYHMAFHTSKRPYKCQVCGKSFKLIVFLRTHQKAVHGGVILQRSENRSRSFMVQSKSISKVKFSDSKGSRKCKIKKTVLINRIFKPISSKMITESKKICKVSKKKVISHDHLKSQVSDGTKRDLKPNASRPKKVCKKTSLSIASSSGVFDGANTKTNKDPKSRCVDGEDFEFERSAMHFTSLVSTKTKHKVVKASSRIKKLKRFHFNAATENIKFIFKNESSVIESDKLPKASISQPKREYKILPVKNTCQKREIEILPIQSTSHPRRNLEKLTLTKENYVKDSKIPLHAHEQMNKKKVRKDFISSKLSIEEKNTPTNGLPKKMNEINITKESCRLDKVMSLFICKVCNKTYKHKTSLNRHFRISAHAPCMCSKADLLEEMSISETKGVENSKKKRCVDEVTPQDCLPQLKTKCIKIMPNMKLNQDLQNQYEKNAFNVAPNVGEVSETPDKVGKPLDLGPKKSGLPGKNLLGKVKPCIKVGNERPKEAYKNVSFLIDSLHIKHPEETIEAVPSRQVIKSSRNITVEHVRNCDKRVMEAHHKSEENAHGNNLMPPLDDSEKIDFKNPVDNTTPSFLQEDCTSRKYSRPDGAMEFPVKSKMQISSQKQMTESSVFQVSSVEHQCAKCLRKFKHAYSLKRHSLMQLCSGGGKKVFGSKSLSSKKNIPQKVLETDQSLITTKQCKTATDHLLKLGSKSNEASFMRDQLKKIHSNLLTETKKNTLPKYDNEALKLMGKVDANRYNVENLGTTSTSPLIKNLPIKPYKCYRCGKSYVRLVFFKKHMNKNSCSSSYKCLFCLKKFTDKAMWEQHVKLEKAVIQNKSYSCAGCMTVFCRPGDLARHIMRNTCSRCNLECFCGYFLDLHEKSSECNGLPAIPLGKCGCLPGSGNCQTCCKNEDPNENSLLHHNDIPYSNSIILKDANDSSTTCDKEAEEANDTLMKAIPSMFQLSFTEGNHDYMLPVTAEDGEEIARNNNVSQSDYLDDESGKFIVNYTDSEMGTDIFQGGNSRSCRVYETGNFEPDAMTIKDNLQTTRVSDIEWPMPQLTNEYSHGCYSQFINYHYYNYSSQLQGQAAERGRNVLDKNGKQMIGDDTLHFESPEYTRPDTSQEMMISTHSTQQQYSAMSTNVLENPCNATSQFKVYGSGDWGSRSLSDNSHSVSIPLHNATVYEIEGFRVTGSGEAHNYENIPGNSGIPNMFENHKFSPLAFPNSSQYTW